MTDVDTQVARLARVRDEELTGVATGPAARALLASVTTSEPARQPRPRRRLVLAAATVIITAAVVVIGPSVGEDTGAAKSYANEAIEVTREGEFFVARIKDPLADHDRYVEAFRAVGKDVVLTFVPVSPRHVGQLLETSSSPNKTTEVTTELVSSGPDPSVCETRPESCTIVIRISADTTATVQYTFGRAARPGESYQDPTRDSGLPSGQPGSGGGN